LAVVFALGNFAIAPLMHFLRPTDWAAVWVFTFAGSILSQAAILCCAAVFIEGSFWRRSIAFCSVAVILWGFWAAGFVVYSLFQNGARALVNSQFADGIQFISLALPLTAIAIQTPLWFFRVYLGWRLMSAEWPCRAVQWLTIRDYLVGTAIVAVALACARLAPGWEDSSYWPNWSMFIASAIGASFISIIPAMLLVFRCRDWRLAIAAIVAYGMFAGLATIGVIAIVDPSFRAGLTTLSGLWNAGQVLTILASFAFFLGLGLKAIRNLGFELVLGRRTTD